MAFFDPRRPAYLANPYPSLAALRKQEPMHWSGVFRAWVPTRYAECSEVLHDTTRFTADPAHTSGARSDAIMAHREAAPLGSVPHLGTTSGEAHRSLRRIVNPVFTPAAVRKAEEGIGAHVERLVESLPTGTPFDFVRMFADPLPKQVMVAVIGCPAGEEDRLYGALRTIEVTRSNAGSGAVGLAAARQAQSTATAVLEPYLKGALPSQTVLGALMPEVGERLCLDEVTSMAAQIATVGADPTAGALANAIIALASHPDAAQQLREQPARMKMAVHELLRFDSPSHIIPRFAVADGELGGKKVHRGDTVFAMIGAANRDPDMFANPDELDFERDARRQLSFGQGDHICLGAPLALAVMEIALAALLRRFRCIELRGAPEYGRAVQLRVPERLMVVCA